MCWVTVMSAPILYIGSVNINTGSSLVSLLVSL